MFCFSFFAVMNNATVNIWVLVLCGHIFSSLGQVPRSGIAQLSKVKLCLPFCPHLMNVCRSYSATFFSISDIVFLHLLHFFCSCSAGLINFILLLKEPTFGLADSLNWKP